jgi:hypothetical protein
MNLSALKKRYENGFSNCIGSEEKLARQGDISEPPPILQQYLKNSGLAGFETKLSSRILWESAKLRMAPGKSWSPISCEQINYFHEPGRLAFMKSRFLGMIPIEAIDEYRNGQGNMVIKTCGFVTLTDAKGKEMDQGELVTILAETIFLPLYSLQAYIQWRIIDPLTLEGTIEDEGNVACGLFHFDDQGFISHFETNDRFYSKDGIYIRAKWTAFAGDYQSVNNFYLPTRFKAVWHLPDGDYEYFEGRIKEIEFN